MHLVAQHGRIDLQGDAPTEVGGCGTPGPRAACSLRRRGRRLPGDFNFHQRQYAFPITMTVIFETQGTLARQLRAHGVAVGGEPPLVVVRLRLEARRVRELTWEGPEPSQQQRPPSATRVAMLRGWDALRPNRPLASIEMDPFRVYRETNACRASKRIAPVRSRRGPNAPNSM